MKIKVDPARAKVLCENLAGIKTKVESAKAARKIGTGEVSGLCCDIYSVGWSDVECRVVVERFGLEPNECLCGT